ncbi:hypothetical protein ACHAXS_002538, partial [Conticribra weissflogii]
IRKYNNRERLLLRASLLLRPLHRSSTTPQVISYRRDRNDGKNRPDQATVGTATLNASNSLRSHYNTGDTINMSSTKLASIFFTGSWALIATSGAAMTPLSSPSSSSAAATNHHDDETHRVLYNPTSGAVTHPLIPHRVHLQRRRRELLERSRDGGDNSVADTALPPRPHVSRHSLAQSVDHDARNELQNRLGAPNAPRRLQQQMGALYQGYGTHYVDLWVGTPTPQRQTVIVDTGSGVTAFPCEECQNCGSSYHTDGYFVQSKSQTFRALSCNECFRGYCATMDGSKKCRISMSYAEGSSWSAYESFDTCYAGGPHDAPLQAQGHVSSENVDHIDPVDASQFAFELAFGCQVSITGLFITQLADGIMGMENDKTSFWKQMHGKNAIPRPEFSLCFSRQDEAEREGTGAGAMTLGGVDPRLHTTPMVFAKNTKSSGFYAVHVKAVYLREGGGVSAQVTQDDMPRLHKLDVSESTLNNGNVIVDSGTTDTYFTSALQAPFKKAWKQIVGKDYSHAAVNLTPQEIAALPTILIVLSGDDSDLGDDPPGNPDDIPGYAGTVLSPDNPKDVVLAIPASHYLEYDPDNKNYVPRFYVEESSGSVLGANAMMGHDVYFDTENGRVGWAESDCDYNALLTSEGGGSISVAPPPNKEETSSKVEVPNDDQMDYDDDGVGDENKVDDGEYVTKEGDSKESSGSTFSDKAAIILEDMKHSCSSDECRGIAALCVLAALTVVVIMIRRTIARRRVVRQYQEAELEISDLALDSDDDSQDGGRWVDEPPELPRIS